jgi:hypothetical protein
MVLSGVLSLRVKGLLSFHLPAAAGLQFTLLNQTVVDHGGSLSDTGGTLSTRATRGTFKAQAFQVPFVLGFDVATDEVLPSPLAAITYSRSSDEVFTVLPEDVQELVAECRW